MRFESSVTAISATPSEAVAGLGKLFFSSHVAHYDQPPPEVIGHPDEGQLDELGADDRFRFANQLRAWVEIEDGRIAGHGYAGGGHIGSTTLKIGLGSVTVPAVALPDRQNEPEVGDGWVRFTQTAGGRTGVPAPRTVNRPPFVQWAAPIAWTTLTLTIHADGRHEHQLVGASPFPRHWVYDTQGKLVAKSGLTVFKDWYKEAFGSHTPWGDLDSPAIVSAVETALERELSTIIMRCGAKPAIRKIKEGKVLVEQGLPGRELLSGCPE